MTECITQNIVFNKDMKYYRIRRKDIPLYTNRTNKGVFLVSDSYLKVMAEDAKKKGRPDTILDALKTREQFGTYNREKAEVITELPKLMRFIRKQQFDPFEIVIGADGIPTVNFLATAPDTFSHFIIEIEENGNIIEEREIVLDKR